MQEVEHYHCGACKYFKVDADRNESLCKRLNHKAVKFAIPYFKSYDCNQSRGYICSDFEPADWRVYAREHWTSFEDYYLAYLEQWIPYSNVEKGIGFTLNDDTSVRYYVKLKDFIFGNMYDGDRLRAYEKVYYKGKKLMCEPINSIEIGELK